MSRTETVRETVSHGLKGTESELSVKATDEITSQVFFRRAYWRAEDYTAIQIGLQDGGFMIANWTIHAGGEGLLVELHIVDTTIPVCKHPKAREVAGCEDCPDWEGCPCEKVRY